MRWLCAFDGDLLYNPHRGWKDTEITLQNICSIAAQGRRIDCDLPQLPGYHLLSVRRAKLQNRPKRNQSRSAWTWIKACKHNLSAKAPLRTFLFNSRRVAPIDDGEWVRAGALVCKPELRFKERELTANRAQELV